MLRNPETFWFSLVLIDTTIPLLRNFKEFGIFIGANKSCIKFHSDYIFPNSNAKCFYIMQSQLLHLKAFVIIR